MSEWWSYSLRDLLMFSPHTYYRLFERYNSELWPLQLFFLTLGAAAMLLWRRHNSIAGRVLGVLLALCWLWVAWAYHWQRYSSINSGANYFALAFALEALLLLWLGVMRQRLTPVTASTLRQRSGVVLFVLAWLGFPLLAPLLGRSWMQTEIFGMAPDPTALATLGMLLLSGTRPQWWLFPIPVLWCLISGATMWAMDTADFFIAPLAALLATGVAIYGSRK
jgi:Family of unknown function (DUF6064)